MLRRPSILRKSSGKTAGARGTVPPGSRAEAVERRRGLLGETERERTVSPAAARSERAEATRARAKESGFRRIVSGRGRRRPGVAILLEGKELCRQATLERSK